MPYCKTCIQVNPLPRCVAPDGVILLAGITFPNNLNDTLYAIMYNISYDRNWLWTITTDGTGQVVSTDGQPTIGIDITDAYDLMNHAYEMEFTTTSLEPVIATVDGETGCCIKFNTFKPLVGDGEIELTTGQCDA